MTDAASATVSSVTLSSPVRNTDWDGHRSRDAQLTVETVASDRTGALVRVAGELDLATAAPLWGVLRGHLAAGRRFLRLDVSGLTFIDATALSGVSLAHREALANRGTLVLTGVRSLVARVLHLTGLDEVLFISGPRADYDTAEQLDLTSALGDVFDEPQLARRVLVLTRPLTRVSA